MTTQWNTNETDEWADMTPEDMRNIAAMRTELAGKFEQPAAPAPYRFTRDNGFYLVTVPAGEDWCLLDGRISVLERGHVVVLDFAEPIDVEALQAAFVAWMNRG